MLLMVVRSVVDLLQASLRWVLQSVKNTLWKAFVVLFIVLIMLWLSAFMYGTFYYAYMPLVSVSKPVHFQFSSCDSGGASVCSHPTANVSFNNNELLMRGQQYRVLLRLELPESHVNEKLGMFMVTIKLYNRLSKVVSTSSRASMLRYRSPLLQTLHTLFFSALYLSGMEEQKQTLDVELFTQYMDDPFNPAVGCLIEIRNKKIQFYSAHLNIHAYFTGLRYVMYHWPILSAIVGTGCNLATLAALALLSWYRYSMHQRPEMLTEGEDEALTLDDRRRMIRARLNQERIDEQSYQATPLNISAVHQATTPYLEMDLNNAANQAAELELERDSLESASDTEPDDRALDDPSPLKPDSPPGRRALERHTPPDKRLPDRRTPPDQRTPPDRHTPPEQRTKRDRSTPPERRTPPEKRRDRSSPPTRRTHPESPDKSNIQPTNTTCDETIQSSQNVPPGPKGRTTVRGESQVRQRYPIIT